MATEALHGSMACFPGTQTLACRCHPDQLWTQVGPDLIEPRTEPLPVADAARLLLQTRDVLQATAIQVESMMREMQSLRQQWLGANQFIDAIAAAVPGTIASPIIVPEVQRRSVRHHERQATRAHRESRYVEREEKARNKAIAAYMTAGMSRAEAEQEWDKTISGSYEELMDY